MIPKEWRTSPDKIPQNWRPFRDDITLTQDGGGEDENKAWHVFGTDFFPGLGRHWRTHHPVGLQRLYFADRVKPGDKRPFYIEGYDDSPSVNTQNIWTEGLAGAQNKVYVVQTNVRVVQACILMATDPGDLVLDPTCGSGPLPSSPNSGGGAGLRLTHPEWPLLWPERASWVPVIRTIY